MGDKATSPHFAKTDFIAKTGPLPGRPAARVNTMMRSIIALMLVASAALVAVPSASAMAWVPPTQPDPQCPVTDPPAPGEEGIIAEAKQIAHDNTQNACTTEGNAEDIAGIGYRAAMNEVNLVMGIVINVVGPFVDGTQDNVCDAIYGDHPHTEPGCSEIILSLNAEMSLPPIPNGW